MSLDPDNTPAFKPPPGEESNLLDPPNKNALILGASGFMQGIVTLMVLLRIYTRLFLVKQHGWQDYFVILAWILTFPYLALFPQATAAGAGVHQWNVSKSDFIETKKLANTADIIYSIVICTVKLAIIIQIGHIFASTRERLYKGLWLLSTIITLFFISCIFARAFACNPRDRIWDPSVDGTCIDALALVISTAAVNVAVDFGILVIPLERTWRLQMPRRKKWAISGVFATGLFACTSSIMRLVVSVQLIDRKDFTYMWAEVGLWCYAEIASGVVVCCLPVMPQVYRLRLHPIVTSIHSRFSTSPRPSASVGAGRDAGLRELATPVVLSKRSRSQSPYRLHVPRNSFTESSRRLQDLDLELQRPQPPSVVYKSATFEMLDHNRCSNAALSDEQPMDKAYN